MSRDTPARPRRTPPETRDVHPVAGSIEHLVGNAHREPFTSADGKSGVRMERVVIDGEPHILKHLHLADDWIMRATGDYHCRPITLWRTGWLDRIPDRIDHAIVAAAWDERPEGIGGVLLMRDVGDTLLTEGDHEIPLAHHLAFLDHMAALHAAFWGCQVTIGLLPLADRFTWFGPRLASAEQARGGTDLVPTRLLPAGWARFAERAPRAAAIVFPLLDDPAPLVTALRETPQTLVHGDWKAGNLGSHPDGRTVLLDWAATGVAPACADIAWYLCLNRARLPHSKEAALAAYRAALERNGIDTAPWWDRQCALSLLGTLLLLGWEKALGDDDDAARELVWWQAQALAGAKELYG